MSERKKEAYFDGDEVHLMWVDENEHCETIPWPEDWPEVVTPEFVRERGFEVVY